MVDSDKFPSKYNKKTSHFDVISVCGIRRVNLHNYFSKTKKRQVRENLDEKFVTGLTVLKVIGFA